MKSRILIVSHAMELGGAERSLLGLLSALDPEKLDIELFLLRHQGELLPYIPDYVNLLLEIPQYTVLARPMKDTLREGHVLLTAARLWGKWKSAVYNRRKGYSDSGVELEYSHKYTCRFMPKIQPAVEYDLAISFLTPHYFVAEKVRAKKKIAWIHTDYKNVQVDVDSEKAMWSAYDHIISISDSVTESFLHIFPTLGSRIRMIENILPEKLIRLQAAEKDPKELFAKDGSLKLLSIGRFSYAKNFDNIPDICRRLIESGMDVKWYLIGFGGDEALIRKKIQENQMEDRVIILGQKENPYPYITACDLYVQPSRYEGKCVAVREAQMLGRPVVITDYSTAQSQLEDQVDGVVVSSENQKCAERIAEVLKDTQLQARLIENCRRRDYSNSGEASKIYQMLLESK